MRLALFGGSFDPPHRGHVAIALAAADTFALDQVLFAPAGRQPLKRDGHSATWEQRIQMVRLACADADPARFSASTLDAPRADGLPNYTVDTLAVLHAERPADALFSIAGADSFRSIGKWREAVRLFDLAQWLVVSRPGVPLELPDGLELTAAQRGRVHLLDSVHDEVAATDLRQRLAAGDSCHDLLSPSVAEFIREHRLYSGEQGHFVRLEV